MQSPMHEAHEQEEASLQSVLEAAEELERCAEALRAAEEAANDHSDQNAGDVDRINREVGTPPFLPPPVRASYFCPCRCKLNVSQLPINTAEALFPAPKSRKFPFSCGISSANSQVPLLLSLPISLKCA